VRRDRALKLSLAERSQSKPLEDKSPSQVWPERGCISRETADLLRNPAQNRA